MNDVLISITGFAIVFAVLGIITLLVMLLSKCFKPAAEEATEEAIVPTHRQRPKLMLKDVDERTAAMIMAIIADQTDIPMEELEFHSIRLLEDEEGEKK